VSESFEIVFYLFYQDCEIEDQIVLF